MNELERAEGYAENTKLPSEYTIENSSKLSLLSGSFSRSFASRRYGTDNNCTAITITVHQIRFTSYN